ncbi:Vps62-related protein [Bacillus spongiae]|uniref:Vps62-related protein n=1 Tax=Bacillus spongiae TaxID=2683610 RepID=A0ABU8HD17_9BACI
MLWRKKLHLFSIMFTLLFISLIGMNTVDAVGANQYLKISSSDRPGDLDSAKSYVQVLEYDDYIGLNYRFFYPYNGNIGGAGLFPSGSHAGDWEGVKLKINKRTGEIESIRPSAHGGEHDWTNPNKFEYEQNRPVIYSAEHSHANYWTSGKHSRLFGFGNDYTNKGLLWDIADENFIIINDDNTPWMDFDGRWGSSGSVDASDSCGFSCPDSPKFSVSKGWFRDITDATQNSQITNLGENNVALAYTYAKQYAPRVYMQSNEQYFPSTVEWFLKRAELKEDGRRILAKGEVNSWSLVGKSPTVFALDISNYNLSTNTTFNPVLEVDREGTSIFEVVGSGIDTRDYINKTLNFDPNGNTYTFGVWLKAADDSSPQTVTLRLRSQNNLNGGNGDNDAMVSVEVTNEWAYYTVSEVFDEAADWIRTTIYPVGYEFDTGSVLVSAPELRQE